MGASVAATSANNLPLGLGILVVVGVSAHVVNPGIRRRILRMLKPLGVLGVGVFTLYVLFGFGACLVGQACGTREALESSFLGAGLVVARLATMLVASDAVLQTTEISDMEWVFMRLRLPYWAACVVRLTGVATIGVKRDWDAIGDALWLRGCNLRSGTVTRRLRNASFGARPLIERMLRRIGEIDILLESRGFALDSRYPPLSGAGAWRVVDFSLMTLGIIMFVLSALIP